MLQDFVVVITNVLNASGYIRPNPEDRIQYFRIVPNYSEFFPERRKPEDQINGSTKYNRANIYTLLTM